MPYMHSSSAGSTTAWFADRLVEQEAAHEGDTLRALADVVLAELPQGPVEVISTSTEGCALAAVVAALRDSAPTRWRQLHVGRDEAPADGYRPVVVEAVELGLGLRTAIEKALPGAVVISGLESRRGLIAA